MRLCVTGAAGFIGSNFVHRALGDERNSVVALDALTYAGNLENLAGLEETGRYEFVKGSICDATVVEKAVDGCDGIVNFAAESHVDRSIQTPEVFIDTNVRGTHVLAQAALDHGVRMLQVSTDEVYGSIEEGGLFTESSQLRPSSPYAASKAAADLLVLSYVTTFGLDAVITRCGNNYGPRQFPEKLFPLFITNALDDRELPLYGDGLNVRDWIQVDDHNDAILLLLRDGRTGRVYNISARGERTNLEISHMILQGLGKPTSLMRYVKDRPGHDRRYALDPARLESELGWQARVPFEEGLRSTLAWYRENRAWWERIKSGEYRDFYRRQYGERLDGARGVPGREKE